MSVNQHVNVSWLYPNCRSNSNNITIYHLSGTDLNSDQWISMVLAIFTVSHLIFPYPPHQRGFVAEFEIQTFISRNHRQRDRDLNHHPTTPHQTWQWTIHLSLDRNHAMYISYGQSYVRSPSFKKSHAKRTSFMF